MDSKIWQAMDRGWPLVFALADLLLAALFCLESREFFFAQVGCLALGMVLTGFLGMLSRRKYRWLKKLPLVLLAYPLWMGLWEMAHPQGFLGGVFAALLYLFLGFHYFVGWISVCLLFRKRNDEEA